MTDKRKISTIHMVMTALTAAVLCVLGPIAIPVGAVPVSLTSLILYFMIYILGGRLAIMSYGIYFLLGLVGLPVFSGFSGGFGKLAGPTGGYLLGFFVMIPVCAGGMKLSRKRPVQFVAILIGTMMAYALGTLWFMTVMDCDLRYALTVCVLPFIIMDIVKIGLAVWIGPILRKRLWREWQP